MRSAFLGLALCTAAVLVGHDASATDPAIALGEVSTPPATFGLDVSSLRDAAEGEIRKIDAVPRGRRRHVVVSLAMTRAGTDPVDYAVSATVRDAHTGTLLVVVEAGAQSASPVSSELRKQVASAAIRRVIHRIPSALVAK
jgi:hypothetical protein